MRVDKLVFIQLTLKDIILKSIINNFHKHLLVTLGL